MNKKKLTYFTLSITIIIILIGGIYLSYKKQKDQYINTQINRVDLFFEENVKNYESIKVTDCDKTLMGSFAIKGYINNNSKLNFIATINGTSNYQFDNQISTSEELGNMFKTTKEPKKFPSKIIKEKHLNKEDYEADPPSFF